MPLIESRPLVAAMPLTWVDRVLAAGVLGAVLWGALAFGAVYPWAYRPLFLLSAATGAAAWWSCRRAATPPLVAPLLAALAIVALGAFLQAVPLPRELRVAISPATESFLRETSVAYSAAVALAEEGHPLAATLPVPRQPLSIAPGATIEAALMLVSLTILLGGLTRLLSRTGAVGLVSVLITCGVLLAVLGIVQKAVLGDHAWGGMRIYGFWEPNNKLTTPFGPFVNRNHYAGWMVMALALAIGYFLALADTGLRHLRSGWRNRVLWLSTPQGGHLLLVAFAFVLMGAALALTLSRSGVLCFVLAALGGGVLGVYGQRSWKARAALSVALVVLLTAPLAWSDADLQGRFSTSNDPSIQLRREIWRDTLAVMRDYPLVGTGLNTFATGMLAYKTSHTNLDIREAHNEYLQVASEGGLLLGIPALLAAWFLLRGIRAALAADPDDRVTYWVRFGAVLGIVAMALQSLVEFSLQMPGNAVFFTVLCAIALHVPSRRGRGPLLGRAPCAPRPIGGRRRSDGSPRARPTTSSLVGSPV